MRSSSSENFSLSASTASCTRFAVSFSQCSDCDRQWHAYAMNVPISSVRHPLSLQRFRMSMTAPLRLSASSPSEVRMSEQRHCTQPRSLFALRRRRSCCSASMPRPSTMCMMLRSSLASTRSDDAQTRAVWSSLKGNVHMLTIAPMAPWRTILSRVLRSRPRRLRQMAMPCLMVSSSTLARSMMPGMMRWSAILPRLRLSTLRLQSTCEHSRCMYTSPLFAVRTT
mmetsp:Transcript_10958/g.33362  ORF Transcript_10958/g.33362 Transcript_10958/m.33362 type:complete len:225 (-) Transcript_10958:16-690(-)